MINTQGPKKRAGIPSNEVSPDRTEIKNPTTKSGVNNI
jgi:hypothetical protein